MPCHGSPLRPRATKASPADLKVVYFLNHRKVAGTSMLAALKRVAGRVGRDGGSLLIAQEDLRPFNPNLFCKPEISAGVLYVTVLRHPLHRLVSLYHSENNFGDRNPAANRNASAWGAFLDGACARHSGHRLCSNQISTARSNHRVVLHAINATPARWRGDVGSSPLDRARTATSSPRNDLVKNYRGAPDTPVDSTQAIGARRLTTTRGACSASPA
jgi:hypothetical protein